MKHRPNEQPMVKPAVRRFDHLDEKATHHFQDQIILQITEILLILFGRVEDKGTYRNDHMQSRVTYRNQKDLKDNQVMSLTAG